MKIKTLEQLIADLDALRACGKKIVLVYGVFDLMHAGHIRFLQEARRRGDVLVVSLVPDREAHFDSTRQVFNQRLRAETLSALSFVDYVCVADNAIIMETVRQVRPSIYVQSRQEFVGREEAVEEIKQALSAVGGRMEIIDGSLYASSELLNAHFPVHSAETDTYLRQFRERYSADDIVRWLKAIRELRVLVVGDIIIDQYHFCRPYGRASKSATIASQFLYAENYAGGSLAVANHVAGFCRHVTTIGCLGDENSYEPFVRSNLKPGIQAEFFLRPDAPTTVKRRYVQPFMVNKLFEVAWFNDRPLPERVSQDVCDYLRTSLPEHDLVIACDFGHGLIGPSIIELLAREARFLAVNAQTNSINMGYNLITKYPRADYVCIDEEETRMACRDRYSDLYELIPSLAGRLDSRVMTVTRGDRGAVVYQPGTGFSSVPVLSGQVVDTIGAGDAFLSITAPCAALGCPPEVLGFIGNCVGALAVRIVGNKESVEPEPLFRFIEGQLR